MMLKFNSNFKKGIGWGLVILAIFGLFSYLTFIPTQTFAESLIVDPNEHRSLSDITTMQEMSQQICINSHEEETKQLRDTRDNKTYWVTKLKDGNCWMTQNLDYNGGGTATAISSWTSDSNTFQGYNDPGDYIYNDPSGNHSQDTNNSCSGITSLSACSLYQSINPSDASTANQEKMRYHIGNYYSWNAAVNGTGVVSSSPITSGEALGSICPDHWKLPTSNNTNKGSFAYLLAQYGVQSSLASGSSSIYGAPLYFVYSGYLIKGKLWSASDHGLYWSSTPSSNADLAYHLYFNFNGYVSPSNVNYQRYNGFFVRCLAEGDWLLDDNQANVSIQVSPIINLDVTKSADDMVVDFNSIDTSTIDINVSSNQKYQVTLTTDQPNLIPNKSDNSEYSIKMVGSNGGVVEKGKNGWGIKKKLSATDDNNLGSLVDEPTYSPIGTNNDQVTFYRSAGPEALTNQTDPANPLQLEVGVSVDQSLPSDTYSTMVTVTAMAY